MELKVINEKGEAQKSVDASEALFGREYNEALVHQVVVAYNANGRQGTRQQKTRAEVRHSTRKPWRQKGTGRARAGMTSSPLWRGGGRIFPNKPDENFTQKLNRKMYRAGMASILSQLVREERLSVIESLTVEQPKTKLLAGKLQALGMKRRADPHRQARREPVPVLAQPARRAGARGAPRRSREPHAFREGPRDPGRGEVPRGGPGMNQERLMKVILAPVISEKATLVGETAPPGGVRGPARCDQGRDQGRRGAALQGAEGRSGRRERRERQGQGEAARPLHRPSQEHQEGLREPQGRRRHQLRGRSGVHGSRKDQADLGRPPLDGEGRQRRPAQGRAARAAGGEEVPARGPQPHGQHHHPPPGRWPQAALPHRRLPPRQGRDPGEGRAARVRPEPQRQHRAACATPTASAAT